MFYYKVIFIKLNSDRKCDQSASLSISMTKEQNIMPASKYSINYIWSKARETD